MFLDLADALTQITDLVKRSLGPLGNGLTFTLDFAIDFGIQLAATIILFVVVAIFFWKPLTKILEARREKIDQDLEDAEKAKKNAQEIELELQAELKEAKQKVKDMLDKAEKDANIKRDEIINQARKDAKNRMDNLEIELENEKKSMEQEIRKEIVEVAFQAAEKIVSREIERDKYLDVVDNILKGANE